MSARDRDTRDMEKSTTWPPLMVCTTFHWDGLHAVSHDVGLQQGVEYVTQSSLQMQWQPATGRHPQPCVTRSPLCLLPSPPAGDRLSQGGSMLDLLPCPQPVADYRMPQAPQSDRHPALGTPAGTRGRGGPFVYPLLFVHTAYESPQGERVELVPHLATRDPLLHHIILLLQVASAAGGMSRLATELLANALAVHLLERYAVFGQPEPGREAPDGLPPSKLRRTIAHIQAHLEHELSLATLAAVAQMSPAHFARLFKQATGQTPHQYVMRCRIERAQQLLVETDMSLSDIGHQVGCADQSHFTALFRRCVATTPTAYRRAAQR